MSASSSEASTSYTVYSCLLYTSQTLPYVAGVFGYGCGLLGGSVGILFQKGKNGSAVKIISQLAGGNGPVSYTHLDVYKRQEQDDTDPAITKTSSPTAAIPMMICEWLCTN